MPRTKQEWEIIQAELAESLETEKNIYNNFWPVSKCAVNPMISNITYTSRIYIQGILPKSTITKYKYMNNELVEVA